MSLIYYLTELWECTYNEIPTALNSSHKAHNCFNSPAQQWFQNLKNEPSVPACNYLELTVNYVLTERLKLCPCTEHDNGGEYCSKLFVNIFIKKLNLSTRHKVL